MKTTPILLLAGFFPLSLLAAQFPDSHRDYPVGGAADLLQIQREGRMASGNLQAATDLEREKAVDRFLKTYNNAIPATNTGGGFSVGAGN